MASDYALAEEHNLSAECFIDPAFTVEDLSFSRPGVEIAI
jgi:hypothetical protein